ncbi:LysR family transcriptional regulator [Rhizobiaceae bacterium BDR2-2]|uniref:LysR family transcriptional regulator n=1 Tax=Ectorhizobium quercum TaxID=2965071 RepID=A0AAE3SV43_9HYPH|nr:LysR family transcriptional regulator [Ectorhizobium quercum]MCX8997940.1 LysR family transcriptional regulator [Ectorhizobium quercum]
MDFKLLEAFRTVVSNSSITKAAEILGVTQPAVSAQIARLEASIGFNLFTRNGGRLSLTGEGQQFHAQVVHALDMFQRLDHVAEGIREGKSGKLVIASHPSASISLVPVLMARFRRDHPETRIRLINRTSEEVRSFFPAASIDIGIAELPTDIGGVEVRKYALSCVAILPKGHPAAEKACLSPADLSGEPFLAMPPERVISHRIREAFAAEGATLNAIGEVDFFSSICAMVAEGGGVSIVDSWSAAMFSALGLEVRPFEPAIPYEIGVITSSDWPLSRLAQAFLSLIDETLRKEAHHVR